MKKILCLVVIFTAVINNAYQQSPGDYGKDSLPGCQAFFNYYYNDSIETFVEAYPYQFNDFSTGNVVSWLWDFGDGTISSEKNPLHFYEHAGDTVKVCLTITTGDNCTSTYCETLVISSPWIPQECYTSFYMYQDSLVDCLCYRFQGYSNNEVISWHWDFGDGNISEDANPLHHFPADGIYNVCLTVSQVDGQSCSYCQEVYSGWDTIPVDCKTYYEIEILESYPPQYRFVPSTSDSIGWYYWDFGDGQQSWEVSPLHTYQYSGYYNVCLITKTIMGCKSEYCTTQFYTGGPEQCQARWEGYPASWIMDPAINSPQPDSYTYVFFDYSTGMTVSWHWTFGDGTESFEQSPLHSFPGPGLYTVCLEIHAVNNCSSTYCDSVYVAMQEPCSLYGTVMDYSGLDGCGLVISIDNGELLEPRQIVPEFTLKEGQRVVLSYTETPSPSICMVGKTVRIDCIREIEKSECQAAFWYYALPWVSSWPPIYQFESDSSQQIVSWEWDLGDGTVVKERSPLHRFEFTGYHNICLTIVTADGCTDMHCETAWFEGNDPQPGLCKYRLSIQTEMIIGPVYSCEGSASARLLDDQGDEATPQSYLWSTGSTECCITELCANTEYWVTVTDPNGCSITGSFIFYGNGSVPGDTSWTEWNYEKMGMNFNFNVPAYQEGYTCTWDFGDGTSAAGFSVYHTYDEEGEYVVVVTIYDDEGDIAFLKEFTVNTGGESTGITEPASGNDPYVYPVPATDELFIALSLNSPQHATIRVFNTSGQQILTKEFSAAAGPVTLSLDLTDLPPGAYYGIFYPDSGGNRSFKFIK
jgi:PKD repeat protein